MLIKDIVRMYTNAYKIKNNGDIDDRASLTWELVEYFVNGLDCLVSCPKFLLHLDPNCCKARSSQNTQKAEKFRETREYPEN